MTIDILNTKAWVIFLAFLLVFGPIAVLADLIASYLDTPLVTILLSMFVWTVYLLYPVLVGLRLRSLLSSHDRYVTKKNISVILDCCLAEVAYALSGNAREHLPNAIVVCMGVAGLVGLIRLAAFPAHQIRSIELKRNATIWEYASETFQMLYWPLGVLWMQPRINRIATKTIKISE
jgi:hypothetical protein